MVVSLLGGIVGIFLGAMGAWYFVSPIIAYATYRNSKWCRQGHRTLWQWYRAHWHALPFDGERIEARLPEEIGPEFYFDE